MCFTILCTWFMFYNIFFFFCSFHIFDRRVFFILNFLFILCSLWLPWKYFDWCIYTFVWKTNVDLILSLLDANKSHWSSTTWFIAAKWWIKKKFIWSTAREFQEKKNTFRQSRDNMILITYQFNGNHRKLLSSNEDCTTCR